MTASAVTNRVPFGSESALPRATNAWAHACHSLPAPPIDAPRSESVGSACSAGLTQLVECQLPKLDVASSNLVSRSETPRKRALREFSSHAAARTMRLALLGARAEFAGNSCRRCVSTRVEWWETWWPVTLREAFRQTVVVSES